MRGKIVLALFVLTFAGLYAAIRFRAELDSKQVVVARAVSPVAPRSNPTIDHEAPALTAGAVETIPVDKPFAEWLEREAAAMDQIHVDGESKKQQIREVVAKMTPQQARQLRRTMIHPQSKAGEKILSAYLLVEGGLNTREELVRVIATPLRETGGDAHSEGELAGIREKSLRIMAVDGLYAQAQSDPSAREALARAIRDSEDSYIKAYAQQKFDQLP